MVVGMAGAGACVRAEGDGLAASIYSNATFSGAAVISRVDRTVNFDWSLPGAKDVASKPFSIRWTGQIEAQEAGEHAIRIESAGGVRLWIDGQSVVYDWKNHGRTVDIGTVALDGGKHDLRMQYYHTDGPAMVRLLWRRPGQQAFEVVPRSQLYSAATLDYVASWVGNSFSGASGEWAAGKAPMSVPGDVDGAFVGPDGSVYVVGRSGAWVAKEGVAALLGGAGWPGASGITADEGHVYASGAVSRAGPGGETWSGSGVRRYIRSIGRVAPFEKGLGVAGDFWEINKLADAPRPAGLAANDRWQELFVADPWENDVKVFSTVRTSQFLLRRWGFESPHRLAVDQTGNVWVSRRRTVESAGAVVCFTRRGDELKSVRDVKDPTAIAVDGEGRLMVADGDVVRIYDVVDEVKLLRTFGGSIFAGERPGLARARRFAGIVGVGAGARGEICIAQNGIGPRLSGERDWADGGLGTIIEGYNPESGVRNWALYGLGGMEVGDIDPESESDLYTVHHRLKLDFAQPAGREWSHFAITCNPTKYRQDARLGDNLRRGMVHVRRIGGKVILFAADPNGGKLCIYRFTDGEVAAPSGAMAREHYSESHAVMGKDGWPANQPARGGWIWRDANGDGKMDGGEYAQPKATEAARFSPSGASVAWWPDGKGDVWSLGIGGGIRRFVNGGPDRWGNPTYDYGRVEDSAIPAPLTSAARIVYFPESDTMWLSGHTAERPDPGGVWGRIGTVICRYDNWSNGRKLALQIAIPHVSDLEPVAMSVAGNYVFVQYLRKVETRIYRARSGAYVGMLEPTAPLAEDQADSFPGQMRDYLRAYKRGTGEYIVLVADPRYAKMIMYRWRPGGR